MGQWLVFVSIKIPSYAIENTLPSCSLNTSNPTVVYNISVSFLEKMQFSWMTKTIFNALCYRLDEQPFMSLKKTCVWHEVQWTELLHSCLNAIVLAFIKHMQDSQKPSKRAEIQNTPWELDRMQNRFKAQIKPNTAQFPELAIL